MLWSDGSRYAQERQGGMKRRLSPARVVLVLAFLALHSCGATRDPTYEDKPRLAMERPPVSYLEETIPPCTPIEGSSLNTCRPGIPPDIEYLALAHRFTPIISVSYQPSGEISVERIDTSAFTLAMSEFPNIEEFMLGKGQALSTPHIVIRGTVSPNTTRCEKYPSPLTPFRVGYYCFVDVLINEYLAGIGPAQLTIGIYSDFLVIDDSYIPVTSSNGKQEEPLPWKLISNEWLEQFFDYPATRTVVAYEGKELILFLVPSYFLEAWDTEGVAFLKPDSDGTGAVVGYLYLNGLSERRNHLGIPLTELAHQVKLASELREEIWEELRAEDRYLPSVLVTDANKLKDIYKEGAELPPPVPVLPGS